MFTHQNSSLLIGCHFRALGPLSYAFIWQTRVNQRVTAESRYEASRWKVLIAILELQRVHWGNIQEQNVS